MAPDDILEPLPDEEEPIRIEEASDEEPISLVGGGLGSNSGEGMGLRSFGGGAEAKPEFKFNRPMNTDGKGATRFKMFHSKIALAPLEHMEKSINEWIDGDEIEVKHIGQIIGTMEGKRPEPNLLVMVWY